MLWKLLRSKSAPDDMITLSRTSSRHPYPAPFPSRLSSSIQKAEPTMERRKPKQADPIGRNVNLDQAITSKLPLGSKILSVIPSGQSLWVATVKITVQLPNDTTAEFFKKGAPGAVGEHMMKGTFEAEKALYSFIPDRVPRPIAWGTYVDDPDTHFYMCDFVDMYDDLPGSREWAEAVSTLHLNSMGKSPTGQFGFHVTTHLANVPVNNAWNPSWEAFWAQQMKSLFDQDDKVHEDRDAELDALKAAFMEKAIPRYLGPLESDGQSIQPCLIHSDLWPGNIKPTTATDELCLFDACAYWGHNEAELGICRNPRYKLGPPCIREYLKRVPISEPVADFDGRNAVYAMKYHALLSIMYSKDLRFRQTLKDELAAVMKTVDLSRTESAMRL